MPQAEVRPLAALVRRYRLSAGLSQEELAERTGLSVRTISDIERGLSLTPRPETIRMLADGLGLANTDRALLITAARPELLTRRSNGPSEQTPPSGNQASEVPSFPGELIGRDSEVAELTTRVMQGDVRLITLTGPGGVGKTRLALEVARRVAPAFPGGAVFVDLASIFDSNLVASAIAQALKIPETRDRSPEHALRNALAARPPMLLVLDNFEQVIEAAPMVRALLDAAPRLIVLVTSREALRVRGEVEVETEPLDVPPAAESIEFALASRIPSVALFVQSVSSVKPDFVLTELDVAPVLEICRRLDGLPLAIELAATRVRHFPPVVLLRHLEPRLPLLYGGARDLPERQKTIRNTIGWSYDLLDNDERALFRQLGVFVGGSSMEAMEEIVADACDPQLDLLGALSSLVDKHLVRRRIQQDGSLRFHMLEVVRQFAVEQLHQLHEYQSARQTHAELFLRLLRAQGLTLTAYLHGFTAQNLIEIEIDNIRAAMSWFDEQHDPESLAKFADSIWSYYFDHDLHREARTLGERILDLARDHPLSEPLRVAVLGSLSVTLSVLGDVERSLDYANESVGRASKLPSQPTLLPLTLFGLTIALRNQHRFAEAMAYAESALAAARIPGVDPFVEPHALYHIGRLAYLQKDIDRAEGCLAASLGQIRRLGPTDILLSMLDMLAAVHLRQGKLTEAVALLRESHSLFPPARYTDVWFDIVVLLAARCGSPEQAARMLGCFSAYYASLGIDRVNGDPWLEEEIASLRDHLGESHFDAEYDAGTALTMEQVMEIALEVLDLADAGPAPAPTP